MNDKGRTRSGRDEAAKRYQGMKRRVKHCHPMVASTAVEIIMASYEALMSHNEHYKIFKEGCKSKLGRDATTKELEQMYLEHNWGKGVPAARATLARMLDPANSPGLDEDARISIHDALVLDKSLQMGRGTDMWEKMGVRRQ